MTANTAGGALGDRIGEPGANGKVFCNNGYVANKVIAKEVRRSLYKYSAKTIAKNVAIETATKKRLQFHQEDSYLELLLQE